MSPSRLGYGYKKPQVTSIKYLQQPNLQRQPTKNRRTTSASIRKVPCISHTRTCSADAPNPLSRPKRGHILLSLTTFRVTKQMSMLTVSDKRNSRFLFKEPIPINDDWVKIGIKRFPLVDRSLLRPPYKLDNCAVNSTSSTCIRVLLGRHKSRSWWARNVKKVSEENSSFIIFFSFFLLFFKGLGVMLLPMCVDIYITKQFSRRCVSRLFPCFPTLF